MDSKVRHNSDEMDKKVQWERDEMDKTVREERAAVDRMMTQEREKMDRKLKHIHDETDKKVKLEREEMDKKINQARAAIYRALKQERTTMDQKLQQERDDLDLKVQLQRAKMDCKTMQARADMDQKLQQQREDMDSKDMLEQVHLEAKMMQDRARIHPKATTDKIQLHVPPPDTTEYPSTQTIAYPSTHVLVMEFSIHVDGEISYDPKGYFGGRTGLMIINEPAKVEWWLMVNNLKPHGYKGNADLYYLQPGCIPPDGMVLITDPEHVEQMMQAHKGRKKCDLYIARNGPPSDDIHAGMSEEGRVDLDEDWSSPRTEQPPLHTHKKALTFSSCHEKTTP